MPYEPTIWEDGVTPLSATNMNKIEAGIEAAQNSAEGAQSTADGAQGDIDIHAALTGVNAHGDSLVNSIAVYNASPQIDPNTSTNSYILTNHANSPNSAYYWHIMTFFPVTTKDGQRVQIAMQYNATSTEMYIRNYYPANWTTWKKVWHEGNIANPMTYKGTFTDTATSVPAGSTYTKTIAIGGSGKTAGQIMLKSGIYGCTVMFTTTAADAMSSSNGYNSSAVTFHAGATTLSGGIFGNTGGTIGAISLRSVRINGSNLEVTWVNGDGSNAGILAVSNALWSVY